MCIRDRKKGILTITEEKMTRFWIRLEDGVNFVINSIKNMKGGEIFIPKIPSMKIMDLANTIAPNAEKKIIGIRPGEKMHEVLISDEEAHHCSRSGDYYAIHAMLPELFNGKQFDTTILTGEYSSGDDVLDLEGTIALLKHHQLMVEDVRLSTTGELLK